METGVDCSGPSPGPSPVGRGVKCEVTPIGLLAWGVVVFSLIEDIPFSHRGYFFSLTEGTEFTERLGAGFERTEGLRHTEFTERFSYRWV